MNTEQIPFDQLYREILNKEMYFHCDYEDAVVRTLPTTGAVLFFVKLHHCGQEYEVDQSSGIALQTMASPVPITREEYINF